jgi:Leucine-rich repeat (LRR) protein
MLLILLISQICSVSSFTGGQDASGLQALKLGWNGSPESWKGSDPCGTKDWVGITCDSNNRVITISLGNLNLEGKLSEEITLLNELQNLDLTGNRKLSGPIPQKIGELNKLKNLYLMGCNFSGLIPESIGSLEQLTYLSLNLNKLTGTIPASIGRLSNLFWFDISDNQIEGTIPVSNGTSLPGLDMLLHAQHFHFGNNKLTGDIPKELFSSKMNLIHVLFDRNEFTGPVPDTIGLVKNLTVLRLDRNRFTGEIPSSLNNLTALSELYLSNNRFTGSLPSLTSLNSLYTLDVSNNNKLKSSLIPSWIYSLRSLSTLRMEGINLEGPIPILLFSPVLLQTV